MRRLAVALATLSLIPVGCLALITTAINTNTATDCADLAVILETIRTMESGGNYTEQTHSRASGYTTASGNPSGAYQFVYNTWNGHGGYDEAYQAPPAVQDARATIDVTTALEQHAHDVSAVPVYWYYPRALVEPALMDLVPNPEHNSLTPRAYQARWLAKHAEVAERQATCAPVTGFDHLPCERLSWGGHTNGRIPTASLRWSPNSGYMFPPASTAYDQLASAAKAAGFNITGSSYRPAELQDNGIKSCHGLGLAVDITVLIPNQQLNPGGCATVADCFATPLWQWLNTNAGRYGFAFPRWAIEGRGCIQGGGCGHRESWHIEWANFAH